jgi:hypothetical protein
VAVIGVHVGAAYANGLDLEHNFVSSQLWVGLFAVGHFTSVGVSQGFHDLPWVLF